MFCTMDRFQIYVLILFVVCFTKFVSTIPQLFTDKYNNCEYDISVGKKTKKLVFPDKTWTIDRKDFSLYFSLCGTRLSQCHNQSSSCLIQRGNNEILDLGKGFTKVDSNEFILESLNGGRCLNTDKNYTLTVSFACSNIIKSNPRLMLNDEEDDCRYEVSMMRPDCRPKCTDIIRGAYLVDIRNFPKVIEVKSDSRVFSLSPCGSNSNCDTSGTSACEIINGSIIPLAQVDSQILNYDVGKNELTARGRFKQGRVLRDVEILIKCNWETNMSTPIYKKVQQQGKHYRFELQSSYGCIKLPQICTVSARDNFHYNLSQLNNVDGWSVTGVPRGENIVLNICGPLKQTSGICSEQQSQVCHFDGVNYINRGSILSSLTAEYDILNAAFVSGSTCKENSSFLYSTKIEFICSKEERGPIFREYRGCVMFLTWETPYACYVDYYQGANCYINMPSGNRNMKHIYTQNDKIYSLSPDSQIVYNLCGPIHNTCNNYNNVSFCLKTKQNETVLGWDTRQLISEKGHLMMPLTGERCLNQRREAEVFVNFICNYREPSPPSRIDVIEDGCRLNVTIYTALACLSPNEFDDCAYKHGDMLYDLSPLSSKNENYVIPGDQNIDYIFNLCGPVVTEPDVLCGSKAMVCLRNNTELNPRKQFASLGSVGGPIFINNSLIVEAKMGLYCPGLGYYKSYFHFSCSHTAQSPVFLKSEPCVYHFKWEVPQACSLNCEIRSSSSDTRMDLSNLGKKKLKINIDNVTSYEFHLCKDLYIQNVKGDSQNLSLTRDLFRKNNKIYIMLKIHEDCKNGRLSKVLLELQCYDKEETLFEQKSFENCISTILVRSHVFCSYVKENKVSNDVLRSSTLKNLEIEPTVPSVKQVIVTVSPVKSVLLSSVKNCSVNSTATGFGFELNKLKSSKKKIGTTEYSINFNGELKDCKSILCKNNSEMLPLDECPTGLFKNSQRSVTLHYTPLIPCSSKDFYNVEVRLNCNETKSEENLKEVEQCKFILEYNLPSVCLLFTQEIAKKSSVSTILGSIVGIVFVILSIVIIYLNRRRCFRPSYINISRCNKAAVPIYIRNFRE